MCRGEKHTVHIQKQCLQIGCWDFRKVVTSQRQIHRPQPRPRGCKNTATRHVNVFF